MFVIRKSCSECICEHELEVKIASASRSMFPAPIAYAHEATVLNLTTHTPLFRGVQVGSLHLRGEGDDDRLVLPYDRATTL